MFVGKFLKPFNTCVISAHSFVILSLYFVTCKVLKEGITSGTSFVVSSWS